MRPKTMAKVWRATTYIATFTFLFWIAETVAFLFIEGWHWKATNEYEILCDRIVVVLLNVVGFLLTFCVLYIAQAFYNTIRDNSK